MAQYSLQIALAWCRTDGVVVLDRADLFDSVNFKGLMSLLQTLMQHPKAPAIMVCGTGLKGPDYNQDGYNYQVEDGIASRI